MALVPLPDGVSDAAALRGADRAATDVAYLTMHVMARVSRAWTLSRTARQRMRSEPWPAGAFADAEAGAQALDAALADGGDDALREAVSGYDGISALLEGASTRAQGGEALEGKTILQTLAGTQAGAAVIYGGAVAAGVQEKLGDPLGAAAGIKEQIAAGNDPEGIAGAGLEKGREVASIGLAIGAVVAVIAVVGVALYLSK